MDKKKWNSSDVLFSDIFEWKLGKTSFGQMDHIELEFSEENTRVQLANIQTLNYFLLVECAIKGNKVFF